ncbi:unnamed protein product [Phytophthora lilii]|uniref:Unnamed protein product n=1 Tax=Phytophthora lilii TaxID=2077276 RepID=A0A9W6TDD6_9STRA|nr:unnamed protein product [Phytophthora lilii]
MQTSISILLAFAVVSSQITAQTYIQSGDYFIPMLQRVNEEVLPKDFQHSVGTTSCRRQLSVCPMTWQPTIVGHTGTDGSTMGQRLKDAGYEGGASAENAEGGSPNVAKAMDDWMHSEGHRTNIMGITQ